MSANITDQQTNTTTTTMVMMCSTEMIANNMKGGKEDMTEKRFTSDYNGDEHLFTHFLENGKPMTKKEVLNQLNKLYKENNRLKKELTIYRKIAYCSNCKYHNYNWYDDGDEFEVCDKGNDVTDGICEDWEEL